MAELSTLGSVIKPAYEGQSNTHAFDDAAFAKLAGIQALAKDDPTIKNEGVALTKRSILNFLGAGVDAVDSGSQIDITIPGGGSGGTSTVALTTGTSAATAYSHAVATSIADLLSAGVAPATGFGIYPNSGFDETVRIQNALLDLQNEGPNPITGRKRALYFQNGTYLTTGITTTTSTMLVGDGGAVFQFNGTHGANTYVLKVTIPGSGPRVTYGMCRGIKINGMSPANEIAQSGIWFVTPTDWSTLLSQVQIFQCGLYAVRVAGVTNLLINDFRVDAVGRSAILIEAPDPRQNMIAINQGTVTFNDPGVISRWQTQGYIASGSVGGSVAYWGAAVLELAHPGGNGGNCFAAMRDVAVEWHFDGDQTGNGVILDRNAGNLKPNRLYMSNIHGYSDSATAGHQLVGFNGTNGNQPIVTVRHANLDPSGVVRAIRDFTTNTNYGNTMTHSFCWAPGQFFAENGATMFGLASARPAANAYLNGFSYFATDTLALSFHVNNSWTTVSGGSGGGFVFNVQQAGTTITPPQSTLNFIGNVTVTSDPGNNRNTVNVLSGGSGGSAHTIVDADTATTLPLRTNLAFVGPNVVATDDALTDSTIVTVSPPPEPTGGGTLVPGAILITAEFTPYNQLTQSGPTTFALDVANSTYNWGVAVFTLVSDGSLLTWNANLVHSDTGNNSDLAPSFSVGPHQIMVAFDEGAGKGRVYYSQASDTTKLPLAGGTVTGDIKLGTGGSITGLNRNLVSGVVFKNTARGFFAVGNVSGAVTLDYRNGYWQQMVVVDTVTSLTVTNVPQTGNVAEMRLQIHQGPGNKTVSFGSNFYYPAIANPYVLTVTANKFDMLDIASWDGGVSWLSFGTSKDFGAAPYAPNGVVFNGSTYLARNGAFTGAVNSTDFTCAFSFKFAGGASDQHILSLNQSIANGVPTLIIGRDASNRIYVYGGNGSTTNLRFNSGVANNGQWYNICISVGATAHHLYSNDASSLTLTTHNNVARNFANTQNAIGTFCDPPGSANTLVNGVELSDLWFQAGLLTDFSITSNRRKFFDANNNLVFKGANGQTPFGTAPTLFLSGATNTWPTNLGSGGGMTLTGTLGTSASPPVGA